VPNKDDIAHAKRVRKAFLDDPIHFVSHCIVMTAYTNATGRAAGGLVSFAMIRTTDYEGQTFLGKSIPVFAVVDGSGYKDGAFMGYWCPYQNNALKSTMVWKEGNALFTDKMDGCTFGVGSVGPQGAVRVCHVNENQYQVSSNDTAAMEQAQHDEALADLGSGAKLFEPAQYRRKGGEAKKLAATTFGIRDSKTNTWAFYAQLTEGGGMDPITLRAVKKVA
jgi:hypothetical protein